MRFVRFLGEVIARQFCFEIYWPLASTSWNFFVFLEWFCLSSFHISDIQDWNYVHVCCKSLVPQFSQQKIQSMLKWCLVHPSMVVCHPYQNTYNLFAKLRDKSGPKPRPAANNSSLGHFRPWNSRQVLPWGVKTSPALRQFKTSPALRQVRP